LIEIKSSIDDHIAKIDHTIALLQLGSAPSGKPRKVSVGSQTDIHLPKSKLRTSPLTSLQKEEEDRKK
jgi:hypothetical protein